MAPDSSTNCNNTATSLLSWINPTPSALFPSLWPATAAARWDTSQA